MPDSQVKISSSTADVPLGRCRPKSVHLLLQHYPSTSLMLQSSSRPRSIFFFQAEDGIRATSVTGVQTCALPISWRHAAAISPEVCPLQLINSPPGKDGRGVPPRVGGRPAPSLSGV